MYDSINLHVNRILHNRFKSFKKILPSYLIMVLPVSQMRICCVEYPNFPVHGISL
ncbi:hypothetical protein SDC9_163190 [bioreactor metagenome]|uniref:Uncharacterized protein n=1 Tax=bioreactor metagenome TaxID=1076179 RepID=A0A645FV08_9ZZZZ